MDEAYNQHSIRRKSRSAVNLNHLSLAPLTSKLPIRDSDEYDVSPTSAPPRVSTSYSYLQGKSAPTTPRLLSRSPGPTTARSASVSRQRGSDNGNIPKSKSAVHLVTPRNHNGRRIAASSATSPTSARRGSTYPHHLNKNDISDSDWLLRCGALISTETRESKGQAWLISRASSTSLAGMHDAEEEAFERELARERQELNGYQSLTHSRHASRRGSRRNSVHNMDGEDSLSSPTYSRFGSRSHSRVGNMTPGGLNSGIESRRSLVFVEDYFNSNGSTPTGIAEEGHEEAIPGPDFVNLDEELEAAAEEDSGVDDEAYVRKLVKGRHGAAGSWFSNVLGVKLFAVEEDGEESDDDGATTESEEMDEAALRERRVSSLRRLEGANMTVDANIPPPKPDEGGWHDAAWLLTLASKVLL